MIRASFEFRRVLDFRGIDRRGKESSVDSRPAKVRYFSSASSFRRANTPEVRHMLRNDDNVEINGSRYFRGRLKARFAFAVRKCLLSPHCKTFAMTLHSPADSKSRGITVRCTFCLLSHGRCGSFKILAPVPFVGPVSDRKAGKPAYLLQSTLAMYFPCSDIRSRVVRT